MAKIHLLDDLTANQIAAGEVIERPVSVVKELIENAIDAGAQNIALKIEQGGLDSIIIRDDGTGMSKEDALLAVKRHATSKLLTIGDLDALSTLGFRGEALPSIISVARVEIISRERGCDHGVRLRLEGNVLFSVEPVGTPVGTTVQVSDLFFNTPARKKFMRTPGYEAGLIHELLIQFALSHPQLNFRLDHEGKEILNTAGINCLPDLIALFYGSAAKEALIKLDEALEQGRIAGHLTLPAYHRVNRKAIHFYINSRRVIAKELLLALSEAYENMLPRGRFPLAVFHIELHPSLIDVNVHPSKLEIRFRDTSVVRETARLFREALQGRIACNAGSPLILAAFPAPTPAIVPAPTSAAVPVPNPDTAPAPASATESIRDCAYPNSVYPDSIYPDSLPADTVASAAVQERWECFEAPAAPIEAPAAQAKPLETPDTAAPVEPRGILPRLRIIGQLAATFIVAEGEAGLYLIDQHVAHERIIFEQLQEQARNKAAASQLLLHSTPLQLTTLEEELVIEHILPLNDLGIILEHFGPRSYLLRAVPSGLKESPEDFFYALLEQLAKTTKKMSPADVQREFLIMTACKSAVKANQVLSGAEMNKLISDLGTAENPLTCPHGRPIIHLIPEKDILKAFRRL